jgi:predicted site-specific integrase-resolvase
LIEIDTAVDSSVIACIYARVSSSENKNNLDLQAERLTQYAAAKGYTIHKVVKEVGSGLNDNRKKLNQLLSDRTFNSELQSNGDNETC